LTARPAESEHLKGKSTTPLYLVNSNKVCENSLYLRKIASILCFLNETAAFNFSTVQKFERCFWQ
ncbi:hypothetical protein, partial [Peribacillus sp. NPDC058002]|uniref:hypothetical protein n=1 Tax=Peribacillus sp. NPDC058002 TaxID=3346301 RepID=UPI0036DDDA5E